MSLLSIICRARHHQLHPKSLVPFLWDFLFGIEAPPSRSDHPHSGRYTHNGQAPQPKNRQDAAAAEPRIDDSWKYLQ